jgi:hypothetical protein
MTGYGCNTMVNNMFVYGPDDKVFFAAVNFPGSWEDGSLMAHFLHSMKGEPGSIKSVLIRDSPGVETCTGILLGR